MLGFRLDDFLGLKLVKSGLLLQRSRLKLTWTLGFAVVDLLCVIFSTSGQLRLEKSVTNHLHTHICIWGLPGGYFYMIGSTSSERSVKNQLNAWISIWGLTEGSFYLIGSTSSAKSVKNYLDTRMSTSWLPRAEACLVKSASIGEGDLKSSGYTVYICWARLGCILWNYAEISEIYSAKQLGKSRVSTPGNFSVVTPAKFPRVSREYFHLWNKSTIILNVNEEVDLVCGTIIKYLWSERALHKKV